jgi:hypothetical protein
MSLLEMKHAEIVNAEEPSLEMSVSN